MKNRTIELLVGTFVLVGMVLVFYLAVQVGGARWFGGEALTLEARFGDVSGVNAGSRIEVAGVKVGTVESIRLNENFFAIVTLRIDQPLELFDDTIASVKTSGLIGDRFIELSPGGSGIPLEAGDRILDTESALNIEDLISRFALGGIDGEAQ